MRKVKYIRTKENQIIVFSELFQHSDFKHKSPISAGFIVFSTKLVDGHSQPDCICYGKSVSLGLESKPDEDTALAKSQILAEGYC